MAHVLQAPILLTDEDGENDFIIPAGIVVEARSMWANESGAFTLEVIEVNGSRRGFAHLTSEEFHKWMLQPAPAPLLPVSRSLYNDDLSLSDEAREINFQATQLYEKLLDEFTGKGFSPWEIEQVFRGATQSLTARRILAMRKTMKDRG